MKFRFLNPNCGRLSPWRCFQTTSGATLPRELVSCWLFVLGPGCCVVRIPTLLFKHHAVIEGAFGGGVRAGVAEPGGAVSTLVARSTDPWRDRCEGVGGVSGLMCPRRSCCGPDMVFMLAPFGHRVDAGRWWGLYRVSSFHLRHGMSRPTNSMAVGIETVG